MSFEYIDHTADLAVRLQAVDLAGLLGEATRALRDIFAGPPACEGSESIPVRIQAEDGEALLIDYLNELIFLFDTRRFLPSRLDVARLVEGTAPLLEGTLRGETADRSRHDLKTEVKAATFHDIEIRRSPAGLEARVVFDL